MSNWNELTKRGDRIKQLYPEGTRILLNHMSDPHHPVESDTRGTVDFVDDIGQIHAVFDNGRTLAIDPDADNFRKLTDEELESERQILFGDECKIILPKIPVDCSALGFFDTLENECWELVKKYCDKLGVKMLLDENGNIPVSYDVAKDVQDKILDKLQEAGVEMQFKTPELKMQM